MPTSFNWKYHISAWDIIWSAAVLSRAVQSSDNCSQQLHLKMHSDIAVPREHRCNPTRWYQQDIYIACGAARCRAALKSKQLWFRAASCVLLANDATRVRTVPLGTAEISISHNACSTGVVPDGATPADSLSGASGLRPQCACTLTFTLLQSSVNFFYLSCWGDRGRVQGRCISSETYPVPCAVLKCLCQVIPACSMSIIIFLSALSYKCSLVSNHRMSGVTRLCWRRSATATKRL